MCRATPSSQAPGPVLGNVEAGLYPPRCVWAVGTSASRFAPLRLRLPPLQKADSAAPRGVAGINWAARDTEQAGLHRDLAESDLILNKQV